MVTRIRRISFFPPNRRIQFPSHKATPVCRNPSEMMEIPRMVITADPEKPANVSAGVTNPLSPSTTIMINPIKSARTRSEINNTAAIKVISRVRRADGSNRLSNQDLIDCIITVLPWIVQSQDSREKSRL